MGKFKQKLYDWKDRLKDRHMLTIVISLLSIILILGLYTYKKQRDYRQVSENTYNMAFYELLSYVQNVEIFLAKSLISNSPEHGTETLTYVWREANLAQSYLSRLPISTVELENTAKFLNQVSDYTYSLSKKTIYGNELSQEDLNNLKELYNYSEELSNTLNQLATDINEGRIRWGELTKKGSAVFAQQVSNTSKDSFSNIEKNFHEYAGLIYDGAFSEHITNIEKKGLTGNDITEEQAKQKVIDFIGTDKINNISLNGLIDNANIPSYDFRIDTNDEKNIWISVSKKGGHIIYMNYNRDVPAETITEEQAIEIGKKFLEEKNFNNMTETYYLKQDGVITINFAYLQDDITVYSDLIKLKIALDNGEIIGIETTGYLNSHEHRNLNEIIITQAQARDKINKNLEILSEGLALIPTEYKTEVLCWEFRGKVDGKEFLVYINVETGIEEDILIILNTPNGTLAQ